ncbi:uncharacterized protein HD556DRAFT_1309861 [Suillus plorans]|uniref:Uncharacterized protein n=1 Tax=Suillus plorans TaxID=116603 RepID=A0A9P7AM33_9AGAM|nr:uncharacterized protein HD556DRAFT_1309861 [Suillus plorans]KAG1791561.1 hypothetical protein HD556DRAFT_1309861 [Suillus plorans]
MDGYIPILNQDQITPERDRHSQRERDRLNRLQMTSPTRRNRCHAAHDDQNRPPPPVPQPNFVPANEPQAGPVPQPPLYFRYPPLPVEQYPGLPRNAIAHVQRAHHHPPVDYNARLNEQMNAAHNDRCRRHNICQQQDRDEIRQQAQAELMQPPQVLPIHNQHIQPAPPAPPVYGPIHYEGAHNFDNPLHYFAPNHAPPMPMLPEPDYQQFNLQFQNHINAEQREHERIRNDLLQRQAQEEFRRNQVQLQLQQQEAERVRRQAQLQQEEALYLQQQEAERIQRQAQLQQQEAERIQRQAQLQQHEVLRLQQQEAERIQRQAQLQQHETGSIAAAGGSSPTAAASSSPAATAS